MFAATKEGSPSLTSRALSAVLGLKRESEARISLPGRTALRDVSSACEAAHFACLPVGGRHYCTLVAFPKEDKQETKQQGYSKDSRGGTVVAVKTQRTGHGALQYIKKAEPVEEYSRND
jgi:hypothetical protein